MVTTGIILAILIIVVLIVSYVCYRMAFYSSKKRRESYSKLPEEEQYIPHRDLMSSLFTELAEIPFEEVRIKSHDGLTLFGRYYHYRDGAPLEIEFHGYRGHAFRDFCGGNKLTRNSGSNILLVDQRAHGESGGHTITFGVKERFDCLSWCNYAVERFGKDQKIVMAGASMGAATVLMASDLPLPENVKGIIADSPYSSPKDIIKKVCGQDMGIPANLAYPFIWLGASIFGGFNVNSAAAETSVKNTKVPLLIIHGTEDRYVPCSMSRNIYKNCPQDADLLIVENAGHVLSFTTDPERYKNTVAEFKNKILN